MKSVASSFSRKRRRGSVIAIVLAVITLAAFLLTAFVDRATTEMVVETRVAQEARLRQDARSALEAALAVVASFRAEDDGLRSPAQGWGEPLPYLEMSPARAGTLVQVEVMDESGKPSLPRMEEPALTDLLIDLGVRQDEAERIAEALVVWTRKGGNSIRQETAARQYEYAEPSHQPPGRPLASFDELAAVAVAREHFFDEEGRPTALLAAFAEAVSLYDFSSVNLNTATPQALRLAGWGDTDIALFESFRSGPVPRPGEPPRYFRSVAEARALLGGVPPGFDTNARLLRVKVMVQEGPTRLHLEAVVAPATSGGGGGGAGGGGSMPGNGRNGRGAQGTDGTTGQGSAAPSQATPIEFPFTLIAFNETLELNAPLP